MAKRKNVYKQKQTNKQSVNVNIKINNSGRRRKQKALQQQSQKLQSLNQQRERLFINNVVSIPEYNNINELNNKISKLENDIATNALKSEAEAIKNEADRKSALEASTERLRSSRVYKMEPEEEENMKIKKKAFDLLKQNVLNQPNIEGIAETASLGIPVKGIPATPNRFSSLSNEEVGFAGEAIPIAIAQPRVIERMSKNFFKTLKKYYLLPEGVENYDGKNTELNKRLTEIYNNNFKLFTPKKIKKEDKKTKNII